ncbi:hypothetical protein DL765_007516 [Monosporascus sp. GIB2]|nr:hypothetical protein DL765_007516 [Monosporascus sp. GIB2]
MRIDLGEVENAVSSLGHKAVVLFPAEGLSAGNITAVVAFGRPDGTGNLEILPEPEPDSAVVTQLLALRRHISYLIPPYMHPTVWVPTDSLPMLASAKVSRLAVKNFVTRELQEDWLNSWRRMLNTIDLENHIIQPEEAMAIELADIVDKLIGTGDGHRRPEGGKPYHDIILSRAGIDSIKTIQLMRLLSERYNITPTVGKILGSEMSIRDLARYVETLQSHPDGREHVTTQAIDLIEEYRGLSTILQDHFTPKECRPSKLPDAISTVLTTGSAGYLGIEILHQLLKRKETSNIITLIRAPSMDKALNKLVSAAECMGWSLTPYLSKIEIWLGDLSEPNLGLSTAHWERLHGNCSSHEVIDAIIHVGAIVDWTKSYHQLKAVNVISTLTLLNASTHSLLRTGLRPRFIQISGGRKPASSFASSSWETEGLQLARALSAPGTLGYTQTKFLSDLLVCKWASLHGGTQDARARVVMPGFIVGGGPNAVANMDDVLWRLVSTNVGLGMYSSEVNNKWVYLASSAVVARKVLHCIFSAPSSACHSTVDERETMAIPVSDGLSETAFWSLISRSGYPLTGTPHDTWLAAVEAAVEAKGVKHPLYPVLHFVKRGVGLGGDLPAGDGDGCEDEEMKAEVERDVVANLAYMRRMGFLPAVATP